MLEVSSLFEVVVIQLERRQDWETRQILDLFD
jgi:hypothetical protein